MDDEQAGQSGGVNVTAQHGAVKMDHVAGRDNITLNIQGVSEEALRNAEAQLDSFTSQLLSLRLRLQEWKGLHNTIQELQHRFTVCRGAALALGDNKPLPSAGLLGLFARSLATHTRNRDVRLYYFSSDWESCKRSLSNLRVDVLALKHIVDDFPPDYPNSPSNLLTALERLQGQIDDALHDQDGYNLSDLISDFAKQIDDGLYVADKGLLEVANQINDLPHSITLKASL